MRRTPIYKQIAARKPELLDELLKPERLRLLGNPEMIRTLIRMDHSIQQCLSKRKGLDVCSCCYELLRLFLGRSFDPTRLIAKQNAVKTRRHFEELRLKRRTENLALRSLLLRLSLHQPSQFHAVVRVQLRVHLVKQIKRRGICALNRKDQRQSDHRFLPARKLRLRRFLAASKAHAKPNPGELLVVGVLFEHHELGLALWDHFVESVGEVFGYLLKRSRDGFVFTLVQGLESIQNAEQTRMSPWMLSIPLTNS